MYRILLNRETFKKLETYKNSLIMGKLNPGQFLKNSIGSSDLKKLDSIEFLDCILNTKKPQIYAESEVCGDGRDWNLSELSILGDIAIYVPVKAYDNGKHVNPVLHKSLLDVGLIYVPGALLRNSKNIVPADWDEVVQGNSIDPKSYFQLYERRLLAPFLYANSLAKKQNKQCMITIPGLGCGQFAGKFIGKLGELFKEGLNVILKKFVNQLTNIKFIYYDPYNEGENENFQIDHIEFRVRPLLKGNQSKPQLCFPNAYEEDGDDFTELLIFSIVAWDHVSYPGNDFYIGSRATDDGVKAAATDSMYAITNIEGKYDPKVFKYQPPSNFSNWNEVVEMTQLRLIVKDHLEMFP
jgi:hypothetical protein